VASGKSGRLWLAVDDESSEEPEDSAGNGAVFAVDRRAECGTDESCRGERPGFLCRGTLGTPLTVNVANAFHDRANQSDRIVHLSFTSRLGGLPRNYTVSLNSLVKSRIHEYSTHERVR